MWSMSRHSMTALCIIPFCHVLGACSLSQIVEACSCARADDSNMGVNSIVLHSELFDVTEFLKQGSEEIEAHQLL